MKQEFKMEQQEMDDIVAINKNMPPVMKIGDYWSGMDLQEKINHYWERLGLKYGFDSRTVEPHPISDDKLKFIAEPKAREVYIKHIAGEMNNPVQRCLVCGKVLANYRNDAFEKWQPGELFESEKRNPTIFTKSMPEYAEIKNCQP